METHEQQEVSSKLVRVGQQFELYANQGMRDAVVLALFPEEGSALVEYTMPAGTTALRIVHTEGYPYYWGDPIPYTHIPRRFLKQMADNDVTWVRNPQQGKEERELSAESPRQMEERKTREEADAQTRRGRRRQQRQEEEEQAEV